MTDSLRRELRAWRIEVSLIEPGNVATPIWEKSKAAGPFATLLAGAGIPADVVAQAVAHALTAKRPKTRYLVGSDARVRAMLARLLPDRARDALTMRRLGGGTIINVSSAAGLVPTPFGGY